MAAYKPELTKVNAYFQSVDTTKFGNINQAEKVKLEKAINSIGPATNRAYGNLVQAKGRIKDLEGIIKTNKEKIAELEKKLAEAGDACTKAQDAANISDKSCVTLNRKLAEMENTKNNLENNNGFLNETIKGLQAIIDDLTNEMEKIANILGDASDQYEGVGGKKKKAKSAAKKKPAKKAAKKKAVKKPAKKTVGGRKRPAKKTTKRKKPSSGGTCSAKFM